MAIGSVRRCTGASRGLRSRSFGEDFFRPGNFAQTGESPKTKCGGVMRELRLLEGSINRGDEKPIGSWKIVEDRGEYFFIFSFYGILGFWIF